MDDHDYATRCVESWANGKRTIHHEHLRADVAMDVARDVWKDWQPVDYVCVRNERTGCETDRISRDGWF